MFTFDVIRDPIPFDPLKRTFKELSLAEKHMFTVRMIEEVYDRLLEIIDRLNEMENSRPNPSNEGRAA